MDWIGSMVAGPPYSFTCFDITPPLLLLDVNHLPAANGALTLPDASQLSALFASVPAALPGLDKP